MVTHRFWSKLTSLLITTSRSGSTALEYDAALEQKNKTTQLVTLDYHIHNDDDDITNANAIKTDRQKKNLHLNHQKRAISIHFL